MAIVGSATYQSILNPATGTWEAIATLTFTGLSTGQANTVSATSDGTSSGTALLPTTARVIGVPTYVPANGDGSWFETSAPDTDASDNVRFNLTVGASGPTSFRIALRYGPE